MSLLEVLLQNRLIVLSLGLVGIGLFFALLLVILPPIKRIGKAVVSIFQKPRQELEGESYVELEAENTVDEINYEELAEEAQAPKTFFAEKPKTVEAPVVSKAEEGEQAIQAIISSVFDDEENIERNAKLLEQSETVNIEELVVMAQSIAHDLKARRS